MLQNVNVALIYFEALKSGGLLEHGRLLRDLRYIEIISFENKKKLFKPTRLPIIINIKI